MSTSMLEAVARDVFEQELHQAARGRAAGRGARRPGSSTNAEVDDFDFNDAATQVCPVSWLLPELLQMIAERHDEPVSYLRPSIRQLIRERVVMYACAAGMSLAAADELLEQQVDLLVRVLEQVRRQALACGEWSEMVAGPEMFG